MKNLLIKYKLPIGVLIASIISFTFVAGAYATIPSVKGIISACQNRSGQLAVIQPFEQCGKREASLSWDRGVIAYTHLNTLGGSVWYQEPGQSHNIKSLEQMKPEIGQGACIKLNNNLEGRIRYVATGGSIRDSVVYVRGMSQEENDAISAFCEDSSVDILATGNSGSMYLSVY